MDDPLSVAIDGVLPAMRAAEMRLRMAAASRAIAYHPAAFGVLRTEADTTKILGYRDTDYAAYVKAFKKAHTTGTPITKERFRPIAPFGSSYHNYGAALDLEIIGKPAGITDARALTILGELAPAAGLQWGGTFQRADPPHFQLPISLASAKAMWTTYNAMTIKQKSGPFGGITPLVLAILGAIGLILANRIKA